MEKAFGADWIGIYDKKAYVWAQDEGEQGHIAISLTCPKNPVAVNVPTAGGGFDFSGNNEVIAPTKFEPAEITPEETDNILKLMRELGL